MIRKVAGRALVGLGYALVALAAVLAPLAYAFDLLGTIPAIMVALVAIAFGVIVVNVGDRVAADDKPENASAQPLPVRSNVQRGQA